MLLAKMAASMEQIQLGVGLWDNTRDLLHVPSLPIDPSDVFGPDFTSFPEDIRITIPTAIIVGGKDPRWPASIQLAASVLMESHMITAEGMIFPGRPGCHGIFRSCSK